MHGNSSTFVLYYSYCMSYLLRVVDLTLPLALCRVRIARRDDYPQVFRRDRTPIVEVHCDRTREELCRWLS